MTVKPAAILAATLNSGNAAYERLTKPKREKLATLAAMFANTDSVTQIKLLAAVAPEATLASHATTLKRLQETLQMFATDAKLLLRLVLAADGTASLEESTEPTPVEKLAAAMLPLDTRGLAPPRVETPPDFHVFVSLAHEEGKKDAAQMALITKIERRTKLLANNIGHQSKITFFRDSQIDASDPGITHRVTQEVARANAFLVLLWGRYFERIVETDELNLIRDVELPSIKQRLTRTVLTAYGSLKDLDRLRTAHFGDKLVLNYSDPIQHEEDDAKRETYVNSVASALVTLLGRPDPPPASPPDESATDGALQRRATALVPAVDAASAQPKARTSSLARDEVDTAPGNVNGTDLLPELHAWVRKSGASPFCAVLGETGQGKTTAMQMFARELLDARKKKPAGTQPPLPIYIDLRKYPYHADDSIETLLTRVLSESGDIGAATPEALREMLAALHRGELVVIFDGLDERTVGMSREQATHFIQQLWRIFPNDRLIAWRDYFAALATFRAEARRQSEATEKAGVSTGHKVLQGSKPPPPMGKMLLTCRTHYFRDLAELNGMLLDNFRGDSESADFSVYRLLPFNEQQIRHYLKAKLPTRDPDAVMALFCRVHNLRELVERPLLLSFIVKRIDRIETISAASGQEFLTLHLYRDIVADWLTRDDPKHKFASEYKPLLMESLACELWKKRVRTLSVEKLSTWLDTFFSTHPHIDNAHSRVDRELLKEDLRTATFIVHSRRDQQQSSGAAKRVGDASEYSFAHTSFLEYFLAGAIGRQLVEGRLDESLFKLAPPSLETARFLAEWRVAADEDDGEAFDEALAAQLAMHSPAINGWLFLVYQHLHSLGIDINMPTPLCLRDADLTGSAIRGVPHRWLNLRESDFSGTTLTDSDWAFADARGAKFTGAWAGGASFEAVHLSPDALNAAAWSGGARRHQPVTARAAFDDARAAALRPQFDSVHQDWVRSASFDPTGAFIVSASFDKTVKLWNMASGVCVRTFSGHQRGVWSAAFDPSGTFIVSASDDKTVKLWNVTSLACVQTFSGHWDAVLSAAFDPSGAFIVSASADNTVRLWNVASGVCVQTFAGHRDAVRTAAFDPRGEFIVSASHDYTVKLWNVASGACVQTFSGHQRAVLSAAFDPSGAFIVSASVDKTVKLWKVESGACLQTCPGQPDAVRSVVFNPSGTLVVSAAEDHTVRLWNVASGAYVQTFSGHRDRVLSAAFDSTGAFIVSASADHTVKLWNIASGACVQTFAGQQDAVRGAAFDPSGAFIVSASGDNTVKLWNVASGACVRTFSGHRGAVLSVAFDPSGAFIVSASHDSAVKLWNVATGACARTFSAHEGAALNAAFDSSGAFIVSASENAVTLWNVATGACVQKFSGRQYGKLSAALDPTGAFIVSASWDNSVKLRNMVSGACVQTFSGHRNTVRSAAFDPTGAFIVSASDDNTVKLWNVASGTSVQTFSGHLGGVWSAAFDSTGTFIVSASDDNTVKVWHAASRVCVQTFAGHQGAVLSAAFDPSGAFIVSASSDGTIRTWNVKTGACVRISTQLPERQWATLDVAAKRFIAASPGAWRYIGYVDENGHEIEAEALGVITGMEWPVDMRVPA